MHIEWNIGPALVVALGLAFGIVAQALARHARLPGIVILLATGALLGPDGANILRPEVLGHGLEVLVEFAVAVILFEGGLNLEWRRLREQAATIRHLISIGAVVTAAGGAVAAHWILGWDWRMSILFGSLVIVTGPTVITPLLRRIKVKRNVETVLEAEGVFIDAVGAIVAIVALEVALAPTGSSLALGFLSVPSRLVFGALTGVVGGLIIAVLLRLRIVPEGLENVFTLSLALALFQVSDTLMGESGIMSVIVAGFVVGNARTPVHSELKEFKEQLTLMLIGLLFVLLAADVRVGDVTRLGWPGVAVVVALMLIVRPVNVVVSTFRGGMTWREKAFLSWLAPRGIVAAAVASFFFTRLGAAGLGGGAELRALVFLVIAITVVVQGTTGTLVARLLGLRRPSNKGYVILGAYPLGRTIGRILAEAGEDVVLLDANSHSAQEAEKAGFRVVYGNALDERVLIVAETESRKAAIGTLPNEALNILFAKTARREYKVPKAYVAIQGGFGTIDKNMVHEAGATVLFAQQADVELWDVRLRRKLAAAEAWERPSGPEDAKEGDGDVRLPKEMQNKLLPLVHRRGGTTAPVDDRLRVDAGDVVVWLVFEETGDDGRGWLRQQGWRAAAPTPRGGEGAA